MTRLKMKQYQNEVKCGGCGWNTYTLYSFDVGRVTRNTGGLCAECVAEVIHEEKWEILPRNR